MASLAADNSAVDTAQGPMEDSREGSSPVVSVPSEADDSLANLTVNQLIDLQKQENKAKQDTPEAKRKKWIDKFVKDRIKSIAKKEKKNIQTVGLRNLLAMWMLCGQMGSSREMSDLLREKFLYFHDNRTAWLYFVLKGKIVLDEFSAIAKLPEDILIHLLPFLCGDRRDDFPKSIMAMDLFNVLPNVSSDHLANSAHWSAERLIARPLIEPLVLFQLKNSIFCFDTVDDTFQRIAIPNGRTTIPRTLVEDPNKETTVLSFIQKGRTVINESLMRFSSLSHLRALVYFFVFATIKNRDTGGVHMNSRFQGIAKSFANRPHTLYWILLCQELLDSVRVHSDAWSNRLMNRVWDNIKKVNTFDPTKFDFGAQVRQQGLIIFKVEFRVYNHPEMIPGSPCYVRFGIKILPNDLLVAAPRTYGDMLSEWLRQFWNHPISLLFKHSIPKPNADGLPPLSLYNSWSINQTVSNRWLKVHTHREYILDLYLQGRGDKFLCRYRDQQSEIQAKLQFCELSSGHWSTASVPYSTNLWNLLENRYPSVHANGLKFKFKSSLHDEPFELTKDSTVADLSIRRELTIKVPFLRSVTIVNPTPYQRGYETERFHLDYKERVLEWLDKTFPHLKVFKVFSKITFERDFEANEATTIGDYVNFMLQSGRDETYFHTMEITLPKIYPLQVVNSRCFRENRFGYEDESYALNLPYDTLLTKVADDIVAKNPLLIKKEDLRFSYFTHYGNDKCAFDYNETSTIRDLVELTVAAPELRCKKIMQRVPECKLVTREEFYAFTKASALRMAEMLEQKMRGCLQHLTVVRQLTESTRLLREYIFFRESISQSNAPKRQSSLEQLFSLLYLYLFGKGRAWTNKETSCFQRLKDPERLKPSISIAEVNADKSKRFLEMAKVGPGGLYVLAGECLQILQQWQSEGTDEEKKIIDEFVHCIPMKLKKNQHRNDSLESVFEVVIGTLEHCYTSTYHDHHLAIEIDRDGDGEESWGNQNRNRPFLQYIPFTVYCFDGYGGYVPEKRWVLSYSRWLEAAFFLSCLRGRRSFRSEPDCNGLAFVIESCLDETIEQKSPIAMMKQMMAEEEDHELPPFARYRNQRYREVNESPLRFRKDPKSFYKCYFVWTNAKGEEKRVPYEVGHRYVSAKADRNEIQSIDYQSRDPTVSEPWHPYRFLKDGIFYYMKNAYAEPVEHSPTENQKQTLLKRAKKRKSKKSDGGKGKKKKRTMTDAERKVLVKRIAAQYNVTDEEEIRKFEEFLK